MPKKTTEPPLAEGSCVHVTTQADLDAAIAAKACVHVKGDAEESVKQWQAENPPEIEVNGDWGPAT